MAFDLDILKNYGVVVSIDDFCYSDSTTEYMTVYLNEYNNGSVDDSDVLKKTFENIYWKCPDIVTHIELNLRKTSSTSTEAITFKAPFKPVSATQINNDKGTNMFVRSNGTVQGTALLNVSEDVYCYLSYEIE